MDGVVRMRRRASRNSKPTIRRGPTGVSLAFGAAVTTMAYAVRRYCGRVWAAAPVSAALVSFLLYRCFETHERRTQQNEARQGSDYGTERGRRGAP